MEKCAFLFLLLPVLVHSACTCINQKYPCWADSSCWSYSQEFCLSKGGEYCEWQPCQVANCVTCNPEGTECQDCNSSYILTTATECTSPAVAFAATETKILDNMVLLKDSSIYSALKSGFEGSDSGARHDAVLTAVRAFLYFYGDQADLIIVFPKEKLSGSSTYGQYWGYSEDGLLQGYIAINMYTPGYTVMMMHEMGHNWNVFLTNVLPNNPFYSHWGITALDKQGQLGGYSREAIKCVNPADRIPSPTASCTPESNGNVNVIVDWTLGSPQTSNDGTGPYANLELYVMGLLTDEEVTDEYLTYCEISYADYIAARQASSDQISCTNLHIKTAADVKSDMNQEKRMKPDGEQHNNLKVAAVVVTDDGLSSFSNESVGLTWLSEYIKKLPETFAESTNNRATISFEISAPTPSPTVPGTTLAPIPSPTVAPIPSPTVPGTTYAPTIKKIIDNGNQTASPISSPTFSSSASHSGGYYYLAFIPFLFILFTNIVN